MPCHRLRVLTMLIEITSAEQLGLLIRATRKEQRARIDDVAGAVGVGPVFVREVERGKETVQLGRTMRLLAELGLALKVDVPDRVQPRFEALRATGLKPLPKRRRTGSGAPPRKP